MLPSILSSYPEADTRMTEHMPLSALPVIATTANDVPVANGPSNCTRVRFSAIVRVREFDDRSILKNKANLWYSEREIRRIRKQDIRVLYVLLKSSYAAPSIVPKKITDARFTTDSNCFARQAVWDVRGLEDVVDGGESKARNKLRGTLAVLLEQDRQDMEGDEPENSCYELAMRYEKVTRDCVETARWKGEQDRLAVLLQNAEWPSPRLKRVAVDGGPSRLSTDSYSVGPEPAILKTTSRAA